MVSNGVTERWMCDEPEQTAQKMNVSFCVSTHVHCTLCIVCECIYDLYFCTLSLSARDISAILVDELVFVCFFLSTSFWLLLLFSFSSF